MQKILKGKENILSFIHRTSLGVYGFLAVFFTALVAILLLKVWGNVDDFKNRNYVNYEQGWTDAEGKPVAVKKINSDEDIYKVLPATEKNNTLLIGIKTGNAKVYLDENLIYETRLYETWFLGLTPGYIFVETEIPPGEAGRMLHVRIDNPYDDHATKIDDILFGDGSAVVSKKARQLLGSFGLGSLMKGLGLLFILLFFMLNKKFDNAKKWLYIGLFGFLTGVFVTMDSKMFHLLFGYSAIWHVIIELTLMMIPIPIMFYIIEEFELKKKFYPYIIVGIDIIEIIVNFVLNVLDIKEYHETVYFTHIIFGVMSVMGIYIVGNAVKKDFKNHIFDFVGFIMMIIGGITDLVLYYTKSLAVTYIYFRIGIFGFLVFSGIQVISSLMLEYESDVKGDVIRKLAYQDGLTDLCNRTSFIEAMDALEKKMGECVLLALFDVNNLKAVNDTLGHTVGDELILSAANALSEGFSEYGKVFRIGGDEFVIIITGDLIRDKYEKGMALFEAAIKRMNQEQRKYTISVAVGSDSNVISEVCTTQDILKKADAAMYDNKKEMKRRQKV